MKAIFKNRLVEGITYLVISLICLITGLKINNINYTIFLYLMATMFFLAIFRPKELP